MQLNYLINKNIWGRTKTATNAIAPGVTAVTCQTLPCVFGAGGLLLEIDVPPKSIVLSIYIVIDK